MVTNLRAARTGIGARAARRGTARPTLRALENMAAMLDDCEGMLLFGHKSGGRAGRPIGSTPDLPKSKLLALGIGAHGALLKDASPK